MPIIHQNNFNNNTSYGLYNATSLALDAEDNWWGDIQGPNTGGDAIYGNVDADPWSAAENQCTGGGSNQPPNTPANPVPADNAVRVATAGGVSLSWSGGDPDAADTVTYDLYRGTSAEALALYSQDLHTSDLQMTDLAAGMTYYWQIVARDSHQAETAGPVWRFTTSGDPPDLIVSSLTTSPAGHLLAGQGVTFTATIHNSGSGPAVDPFTVDMLIDSVSLGSAAVDAVLLAGESVSVQWTWTYNSADPELQIVADNQSQVSETDEQNNILIMLLSQAADITAPALTGTSPADGVYLQQVDSISATLADSQSAVDDAAVISSFSVTLNGQQSVPGTVGEVSDTFTFAPATTPLADGAYTVTLVATDIQGNAQSHSFGFTVDSQLPAKPAITGGTVTSGLIQIRPAQNTSDQFVIELTGTRDADTSVWINGEIQAGLGDTPWSAQVILQPGDNALEVWLKDRAGNQGASEWVDIRVTVNNTIQLDYNASGRVKSITSMP